MKKKYESLRNISIPLLILIAVFLSILGNGPHPYYRLAKSDLSLAVINHDANKVLSLIENGADVNKPETTGKKMYPLHFAAGMYSNEMGKILLEKGAQPNVVDADENTPLHYAVKGHVDGGEGFVKMLITHGSDASRTNKEGDIPLHTAVSHGNPSVVAYLVKAGKNINTRNRDGKTPLHIAIFYENAGTTEVLLKNNADASIKDNSGNTPGDQIIKRKTYYGTKNREKGEYEKSLERLSMLLIKYGKG